jgi:aryl-alcohol dehydrogenase-like predicted oxidoreductase
MITLKKDDIVGRAGFSLYYPYQLEKILNDEIEIDIVQIPYNLFDRRFENYFQTLRERNIEIHVRSVFLQGLFFMKVKELPAKLKGFAEYISLLKNTANELKINIHELALLFVISNPFTDKIVIGVDNVKHIMDIINTLKDKNKLELVCSNKNRLDKLRVNNETILIPSNWN